MKKYTISLVTALAFLGCGGGSSSDSSSTTSSGTVSDGYVKNAQICIDLDKNYICDTTDKKITSTDENGNFSISTEYLEYPIIAIGGIDIATGESLTEALITPANQTTITPITTLLSSLVKDGETIDDAKTKVASILGIDATKIFNDPVKDIDVAKATVKLVTILDVDNTSYSDLAQKAKTASNINDLSSNSIIDDILSKIDNTTLTDTNLLEQSIKVLVKVAKQDSSLISNIDVDTLATKIKENEDVDIATVIDTYTTSLINNSGDVTSLTAITDNTLNDNGYFMGVVSYNGNEDANFVINLPKGSYTLIAENNTNDLTTQIEFVNDIKENGDSLSTDTTVNMINPRTTSTGVAKISIINNSDTTKQYTIPLKAYSGSSDTLKPASISVIVDSDNVNITSTHTLTLNQENKSVFVKEGQNPDIWTFSVPEDGTYDLSVKGDITNNPLVYFAVTLSEASKDLVDQTTQEGEIQANNISLEAGKTYTIKVSITDDRLPAARADILGSYILELNKQ